MANLDLDRLAGSPPAFVAPSHVVPEPLQPVLALLTQGLNVHSPRLDALVRAVARLERGAAESTELAERRAADSFARAEAADARAEAAREARRR